MPLVVGLQFFTFLLLFFASIFVPYLFIDALEVLVTMFNFCTNLNM